MQICRSGHIIQFLAKTYPNFQPQPQYGGWGWKSYLLCKSGHFIQVLAKNIFWEIDPMHPTPTPWGLGWQTWFPVHSGNFMQFMTKLSSSKLILTPPAWRFASWSPYMERDSQGLYGIYRASSLSVGKYQNVYMYVLYNAPKLPLYLSPYSLCNVPIGLNE